MARNFPKCIDCGCSLKDYRSARCGSDAQKLRDHSHLAVRVKPLSERTAMSERMKRMWQEQREYMSSRIRVPKPALRGENHYRWVKDRSKVKTRHERRQFHDPNYKQWCRAVKDRDGWKCKMAAPECEGKIVAHHILPWAAFPELRYKVNNGITLCHHHHPRTRKMEMELSPYLQGLVAEMSAYR
jgi:hypothetical protein